MFCFWCDAFGNKFNGWNTLDYKIKILQIKKKKEKIIIGVLQYYFTLLESSGYITQECLSKNFLFTGTSKNDCFYLGFKRNF